MDYIVQVIVEVICTKQIDGGHARQQARVLMENSLPKCARMLAVEHCIQMEKTIEEDYGRRR